MSRARTGEDPDLMSGTQPKNRRHPCPLPDDFQREARQSLSESDDAVRDTHLEPEEELEDEDE